MIPCIIPNFDTCECVLNNKVTGDNNTSSLFKYENIMIKIKTEEK